MVLGRDLQVLHLRSPWLHIILSPNFVRLINVQETSTLVYAIPDTNLYCESSIKRMRG